MVEPFVDVFRILRQVHRVEGARGLFKGLGPTLIGVVPARAIHFFTYGNLKHALVTHSTTPGKESSWVHLVAGASAGLATATATNPIWLIKTRMQLPNAREQYGVGTGATWRCIKRVVTQEGVRGLYRGLSASYLGNLIYG